MKKMFYRSIIAFSAIAMLALRGASDLPLSEQFKIAIVENDLEKVRSLISENNINVNDTIDIPTKETLFHFAASRGTDEMVRYLLLNGADPQLTDMYGNNALHYGASHLSPDTINLMILKGGRGDALNGKQGTPLLKAVSADNQEVVDFLLTKYPNQLNHVDIYGLTPLFSAAMEGFPEMVEFLLSKGASTAAGRFRGQKALHVVIDWDKDSAYFHTYENDKKIIAMLIQVNPGLVVIQDNNGNTPLHITVENHDEPSIVAMMLQANPSVLEITNAQGRTPLFIALKERHYKSAEELIKAGASLFTRDNDGKTPYDHLKEAYEEESEELELSYGEEDVVRTVYLKYMEILRLYAINNPHKYPFPELDEVVEEGRMRRIDYEGILQDATVLKALYEYRFKKDIGNMFS